MNGRFIGLGSGGKGRVMLRIDNVSKKFGGVEALIDIDISIENGTILGLIGPNGSGKTTLFNLLTGVYTVDTGTIIFQDSEITNQKPQAIIRGGIARTFQNLRLYQRMTVFNNVWIAQHSMPDVSFGELIWANKKRERARRDAVHEILEITGLADLSEQLVGALPLAQQRRLELARALIRVPNLLLLDEPAGGMTANETAEMGELIRTVAAPGRTCIVIEHKMELIEGICERICVLNFGRLIADGQPKDVFSHPDVLQAYLGRSWSNA